MIEPIIVVGPGRCGTSCVAGALHQLGVFMGTRLVPAHASNPYGHWEDRDFLEPNAALLNQKLGSREWDRIIHALIEKRRQLGVPWGWKDPRTCNLLGRYLEFFSDPKFIRCTRDPEKIEASIMNAYSANGWTWQEARSLRVRREEELDRYLPWYSTLTVDFDELRKDRERNIQRLVDFCELRNVPQSRFHAAVNFIRPDISSSVVA